MSKELNELLTLLHLEQLEQGLFRGQSEHLGLPQVYGGQVLGQACQRRKKPSMKTVRFTRFTATFCALAIPTNLSSTMSKTCVTATALAPAG